MERASLHRLDGIGELRVTRSPEGVALHGRWQTVGNGDLDPIVAAGKAGEVVTYYGPIYDDEQPHVLIRDILVKLQNLQMDPVSDTGDARVTASFVAVDPPDFLVRSTRKCTLTKTLA